MLVKTPKIVALLKVMASLRQDWHSHSEIDDIVMEQGRALYQKNEGRSLDVDSHHQFGASTLERLRRLETEGLVESEIRHGVPVQVPYFHKCCEKWNAWADEENCDHEKKWWNTDYTRRISLTYWRSTVQGQKRAMHMVANATRNFH